MVSMRLFTRADEQQFVPSLESSCSIYCAFESNILVGYCIFRYEDSFVILTDLVTTPPDIALADGLARAAIAAAASRMKEFVRLMNSYELDLFAANLKIFGDNTAKVEDVLATTLCNTSFGG